MAGVAEGSAADAPKVLVWGPPRAGKTSILKVVFQKMSPCEALFIETTKNVEVTSVNRNALVRFKVLDFPGNSMFGEDLNVFKNVGVVVFVVDAQEDSFTGAVSMAKKIILLACRANAKISFDVLVHKLDGDHFFNEDQKCQIQRDIHSKITEELEEKVNAKVTSHCTSIYDHTVFKAFSKIVQKILPEVPTLETSLDYLISNSRMEKAYLFDIISKVYIASDPQPVDIQSYELCSDMIDVVIDVSCIYGITEDGNSIASTIEQDCQSRCIIHLHNGTLLYLNQVDRCLALVCIIRDEVFEHQQYLLDYNIKIFQEALEEIKAARDLPDGP
uniref:Ras-related GTP-binding protein n=1 Tax=Pyrodinium bahamense TaxID=73915 RepID=A0A7S0FXV5_9DINO